MAFVLENGTGKATANSYVSLADADSYVSDYIRNSSTWTSLSDAVKKGYLVEATQSIDLIWGERFIGMKLTQTQALGWPRNVGYDSDGFSVGSDEVPSRVAHATVEMAWRHLNDDGPSTTTGDSTGIIADVGSGNNINEEIAKVGSVTSEKKYSGTKNMGIYFRKIELMLKKIINPSGRVNRA